MKKAIRAPKTGTAIKTATVRTMVVSIECPECGEYVTRENGGTDLYGSEYKPGEIRTCENCGSKFRVSTRIVSA